MIRDNLTDPRMIRGRHDHVSLPAHQISVRTLPQGYGRAETRIGWRVWFVVVDQTGHPIGGNVHVHAPLAESLRSAALAAVRPAPKGPRP